MYKRQVRNKSLNELEHTKVMNEYAQKVQEMSKDSFFQDKVIAEESYRILAVSYTHLLTGIQNTRYRMQR